jgi:hypothetical protein
MIEKVITALMLVVAVIHIIPMTGFIGVAKLQLLYGLPIENNSMEILMRHRAVLFGILGVFFAYAAFNPEYQPLAFIMAFVTIAAFFYLAISVGDYNDGIRKIVMGDIVAAISLVSAIVLFYTKSNLS